MDRLFLIDGNSYIYRAYYAIRNLKSPEGFPTNAVYGFTAAMMKIIREDGPEYMALAFDLPAPTFRHAMFADYKANRPRMPEDLREQVPVIKEIVSALGVPAFEKEGYEADDIIATIALKSARAGLRVFVFSHDKDCLQLAGENITVVRQDRSAAVHDAEKVKAEWGVEPCKIPEVMALCGDASDNIRGVPGVGKKTAGKLIGRFGSLEGVLAGADSIENRALRENIRNSSRLLMLNRELTRLQTDVPVEAPVPALRLRAGSPGDLREIFLKLGFKKLLEKV